MIGLKKYSFFVFIFFLVFFFFIFIFFFKNHSVLYTDFGLMYLQLKHLLFYNFDTFSLNYPAYFLDKNYEFFPYTKPFIAKLDNKLFIDFPPYFPFINSPFYIILKNKGLYVLNFICFVGTLLLIGNFTFLILKDPISRILVLFLYCFGTTITVYNLTFHEYPTALFFSTSAFYCYFRAIQTQKKNFAILSGLSAGISLFFRLEFIFFYISFNFIFLILERKKSFKIIFWFSFAFLLPFITLLVLNQIIHHHPLGLRYYLTITDNETLTITERFQVLVSILFDKERGFFYQSPYLILLFFLPIFFRQFFQKKNFIFLYGSFLTAFVLICFFIPNHGDHISPRYFFSILFLGITLTLFLAENINKKWILGLFCFLILFSLSANYKTYKFVIDSDREISNLVNMIDKNSSEILIFDNYAYPLNLQMIYEKKKFLVYKNLNELQKLIEILEKNKITHFSMIVQNPKNKIENLSNIKFQFIHSQSYKETELKNYIRTK